MYILILVPRVKIGSVRVKGQRGAERCRNEGSP